MFTPNDLAALLYHKKQEQEDEWTPERLQAHWDSHVKNDPECDHHCCCCCHGLAAGEHF